jgi:hypothetical protein
MEIIDKRVRYAVSHADEGLVEHVVRGDLAGVGQRVEHRENYHARLLGEWDRANPIILGGWSNEGDIYAVFEDRGQVVGEVETMNAHPHERVSIHEGANEQRGEHSGSVGQDPHPQMARFAAAVFAKGIKRGIGVRQGVPCVADQHCSSLRKPYRPATFEQRDADLALECLNVLGNGWG